MRPLSSREIRETFLQFFRDHDHRRIDGASLLARNDPTLLYVNSGMAPLKRLFTGEEKPSHRDLCNVQPCIRTIDIDDVGDRHHLTLFEMLGSWSIGHYFKERAVELAYELLVDTLKFPKERLFATYFAGDRRIDVPPDDVSPGAWERVGIARDHIVGLGADNFWGPAGETGPCGPCTEVFFDTGDAFGATWHPGQEFDTTSRYIEIWNAGVFMEFDKKPDGSFPRLPFTSVDTGSGLERMTMAMAGLDSVYDTDLLAPIVSRVTDAFGSATVAPEHRRLLADHLRASTFILAEGVRPSNVDAGYIPRRLLRKCIAVTHRAGVPEYDFESVLDLVISNFSEYYPRLETQRDTIMGRFREERGEFERVIRRGLDQVTRVIAASHDKVATAGSPVNHQPSGEGEKVAMAEGGIGGPAFVIAGREAFTLFATYGLPFDIVRDVAREQGGDVDEAAFHEEFRNHQAISKVLRPRGAPGDGGAAGEWPTEASRFDNVAARIPRTVFTGYDGIEGDATIVALLRGGEAVDAAEAGQRVEVITDTTPFYAESGGQVGDTGVMTAAGVEASVTDTQKSPQGDHVHRVAIEQGTLRMGDPVMLRVDETRRDNIRRNHSATHLLQSVLREIVGDHVHQAGSLVEPSRLRFDFTHTRGLTRDEIYEVERVLNRTVFSDLAQECDVKPMADAVASGALFMEGEKYGDRVRVVDFGGYSVELCGGTHVRATGDINLFRVVSESSISAGVRRITAVTGEAAVEFTLHRDAILAGVAARLRVGVDGVADRVERLAEGAKRSPAAPKGAPTTAQLRRGALSDGTPWTVGLTNGDPASLRVQAADLSGATGGIAVVASDDEGTARVCIAVARPGSDERSDASKLMAQLLPHVEGRGGGKPAFSAGGGARVEGLASLVDAACALLSR